MKRPVKCKNEILHLLKLRCKLSCNGTERIPTAVKRQLSGRVGVDVYASWWQSNLEGFVVFGGLLK